jgi:hypothetical protein
MSKLPFLTNRRRFWIAYGIGGTISFTTSLYVQTVNELSIFRRECEKYDNVDDDVEECMKRKVFNHLIDITPRIFIWSALFPISIYYRSLTAFVYSNAEKQKNTKTH